MPEISLTSQTFERLQARALVLGFANLHEYLTDLAVNPDRDEFVFTPALGAALDEGLADLTSGRKWTSAEVREDIKQLGSEWREKRS